jgi:hypothetical protein
MKPSLLTAIAVLFLVACDSKDDIESFINLDAAELNQKIKEGSEQKEGWTETPLLIVNQLFGPVYNSEGHQTFIFEQYESDSSLTVIVASEGLLDDSVAGEKRIIKFKYINDQWTIEGIKLGFKCYEFRGGHVNYSGQVCP